MSTSHHGGCLCGNIRFSVDRAPDWVTICFCEFCQKATGSAYMVEPIFATEAFSIQSGTPKSYTHVSGGSKKQVYVHFCPDCGSKINLTFERWPERLGVYASAFDDPNWFEISPENTKYIFKHHAQRGVVLPAGFRIFDHHAATPEGEPLQPETLSNPCYVTR